MVFNQGDLSRFKQLQMIILQVTLQVTQRYLLKRKTPKRLIMKHFGVLRVVPPGIEPFALVYSNSLNDCTFITLSFMKAIELASH